MKIFKYLFVLICVVYFVPFHPSQFIGIPPALPPSVHSFHHSLHALPFSSIEFAEIPTDYRDTISTEFKITLSRSTNLIII